MKDSHSHARATAPSHGEVVGADFDLPPPSPIDVTLHVPADAASVPLVRHLVQAALLGAGVGADLVDDVALATDEACTNVVLHGSQTQGENVSYDVALHIATERCVVSVAEREVGALAGVPISAPASTELHEMADASAEHGRGIALMALLMDAVQLETDSAGSFRLLLEKGFRRGEPA